MLYNFDFSIAALVFLLILFIFLKTQFVTDIWSNKIFLAIIGTLFFADLFDILSGMAISYPYSIPLWLNHVLNIGYFTGAGVASGLLPEYVYALITNEDKITMKFGWVNRSILSVYILLALTSPLTGFIYYFDDSRKYTHGTLYALAYLLPVYYMVFSLILVFVHKRNLNRKQFLSIILFVVVANVGTFIQLIFAQDYLLVIFAASVAAFLMLIGFETPDYRELTRVRDELMESQKELSVLHGRELEMSRVLHAKTKSASWAIYFDENANMKEATWSDEFFEMLGYGDDKEKGLIPQEKIYTLWNDSLHPDDRDRMMKIFADGMVYGTGYDEEYRLIDKAGVSHWYHGTGVVKLSETTGKIENYQGLIMDIDDEKKVEELTNEKLKALSELEESRKELQEALKKAESASEAKTRFLSNMSHDIRTPMNAIVGFTDIARENIDNKEMVQDSLSKIESSGKHLLSLINDVLDMSRIESGKTTIELQHTALKELLNGTVGMVESKIKEKNQNLAVNFDGIKDDHVFCDRLHLNEILINILGNAIKFTNEGGTIRMVVRQEETSNTKKPNYIFSIKDSGIGMSEEFLAHIFEPFEREKTSTISRTQGTGLGMAITKSLVDMMGGTIEVKSKINEGSTFIVKLPFEKCEDEILIEGKEASSNKENEEVSKDEMLDVLRTKKILLVDDNETNRLVARRLFEMRNIKITEASDGVEALDMIEKGEPFDIILMDIQMPGIDGYETTDRIKALPDKEKAQVPIIAMTADAFEEDKKKALDYGMKGHVAKPFKIDELIKTLYETLQ